MITITLDTRRSQDQLNLLALPAKKRKRLVWRAANEMKKLAARNVRQQQDPNGQPWAPRKRGKRKMLRGLPKLLQIREPRQDVAELGFTKGTMSAHAGVIANTHQKGHTYKMTAASRRRIAPSDGGKQKQASKAQSKLGVAMLDSQGQLLPIQKILQNIQPLIDKMGGAKAWALLDDAGLGDGALLLQQLIGDATTLDKTLGNLRGVRGLDAANAKAKTMAKSWERLNASWEAIRIAGFSSIMPAINAVLGTFADGAGVVLRWTHLFPNLTKVVSYALLAIVGLSMVTGTWMLVAGVAKLATLGLGIAWSVIMAPLNLLKAGLVAFRAIMLAVNIAMYANPVGLIIAGIVLLIGAVAAVIYYWDDLKQTLADWGVFDAVQAMIDGAAAGWASFMQLLADLSPFQLLGKAVDWLIDKLNMIPGVNIELGSMPDLTMPTMAPLTMPVMPGVMNMPTQEQQRETVNAPLARYRQQDQSKVPSGGLGQQLIQANAAATTANQKPAKALSIGEVHNHFQNPMTPEQMAENVWLETP